MVSYSLKAVIVLVLGGLLALAMSPSAARAGSMPMLDSMTMPGVQMSGMDGCADCQPGDHVEAQCAAACTTPAFAMGPDSGAVAMPDVNDRHRVARFAFPPGVAEPPNPFPPRTTYIG